MSHRRDKKSRAVGGVSSELGSQRIDARAQQIASPCVSVCALDSQDICIACYRSAEEIGNWIVMNDDERRKVLVNTGVRSRKNNPFA